MSTDRDDANDDRAAASGKNCKEYTAEIGVNPHTLAGWRWKLRGRS